MKAILFVLFFATVGACATNYDTLWMRFAPSDITNIKFSSKGNYIAIVADSTYLYNLNGDLVRAYNGGGEPFFTPDEQYLIHLDGYDYSIKKLRVSTGEVVKSIAIPRDSIVVYSALDVSKDSRYVVYAITSKEGGVPFGLGWRVLDMETGELVKEKYYPYVPEKIGVNLQNMRFNATATQLLIQMIKAKKDDTGITKTQDLQRVDIQTGDSLMTYGDHVEGRDMFKVSPNSTYIARVTPSIDSGVFVYRVATGELVNIFHMAGASVEGIDFSPDEKLIVICGNTKWINGIVIWNVESAKESYSNPSGLFRLQFSPDGRLITGYNSYIVALLKPPFLNTSVPVVPDPSADLLYPNPTSGNVTLSFELIRGSSVKLDVVDLRGNIVDSRQYDGLLVGQRNTISYSPHLPVGSYMLRLVAESSVKTYTMIVR